MKTQKLLKHLNKNGCIFVRHGDAHDIYTNPETGRNVPVPRHREVDDILAKEICKELGIPKIK